MQSADLYSQIGNLLRGLEQGADGTERLVEYHPYMWTELAIHQIYEQFGDVVEVKPKSLLKFGSYANLGTSFETVQSQGGTEDYQAANTIDTISSTDAAANTAVLLEGHTIDGNGDFTFVAQEATLNGQNKVTLSTPMARCTRIYNVGASDFAGDVYVYQDTAISGGQPTDATKVHAIALETDQQTEKCSTTISKNDYWLVTQGRASVNKKTTANVDFKLKVRQKGGVFRTSSDISLSNSSGSHDVTFRPFFVIPQNSDVRVDAAASASGVSVSASLNGILLSVKVDN